MTFAVSRKRDAKSLNHVAASVGSENECLALSIELITKGKLATVRDSSADVFSVNASF